MSKREYASVNLKHDVARGLGLRVETAAALMGERTTKSEVLEAMLDLANAHVEEFQDALAHVMARRVDRRTKGSRQVS